MKTKKSALGLGCGGILSFLVVGYALSVLWWSLWLYLGVHISGAEPWSYGWVATHWGLLMPLVLG